MLRPAMAEGIALQTRKRRIDSTSTVFLSLFEVSQCSHGYIIFSHQTSKAKKKEHNFVKDIN